MIAPSRQRRDAQMKAKVIAFINTIINAVKAFLYANASAPLKRDFGSEWLDDRYRLHRSWGLPAVVSKRGYRAWYCRGVLHRRWGPAVKDPDGTRLWYKHGLYHREGGNPAVIRPNGRMEWWVDGVKHRDGDGPAVITGDGGLYWYKKGHMVRSERVE